MSRLSAGHEIDNVPAYLMTTVRHVAAAVGTATRETPQDPQDPWDAERADVGAQWDDPAEHVSLSRPAGKGAGRAARALGEGAVARAEAKGQPLAAVGSQIGTKQGATAVLLHRAREGMRQAFLHAQLGARDDPACQNKWGRMPAYVRGSATARQSERLLGHVDTCSDCRERLAVLMRANDRLPAIVGPALLVFAVGGAGKFLLPFAAGSAGAVTALGGHGGALLDSVRGAVTGGSKVPAVGTAVAAPAISACVAFGSFDSSPLPQERTPVTEVPVAQVPVTGVPVTRAPETCRGPLRGPTGAMRATGLEMGRRPRWCPRSKKSRWLWRNRLAASRWWTSGWVKARSMSNPSRSKKEPVKKEPVKKEPVKEEPETQVEVPEPKVPEAKAPMAGEPKGSHRNVTRLGTRSRMSRRIRRIRR